MNTDMTVVSLGPDDPELINIKTMKVLREASCLILSTEKHAAAKAQASNCKGQLML